MDLRSTLQGHSRLSTPASNTPCSSKTLFASTLQPRHSRYTGFRVVSERLGASQRSRDDEYDEASVRTTSSDSTISTLSDNEVQIPDDFPANAQLFSDSHLQTVPFGMLVYMPIGVVVAALRMACWVSGVLLDASWFRNQAVVDTYLNILGFRTTWKNKHLIPKGHHVMVSNHTTSADLMILFQTSQRYIHLITNAMPARVTSTKHLPVILKPATPAVYEQLASASSEDAPPVHVFPEGGLTNGSGMMKFSRGFMKFVTPGTPVVPVALKANTPWGIRTHTLTSSFLANLFWLSFCPSVEIEATVLPPMYQGEAEGRGAFVQRVQDAIALELEIPVTGVTIQQKRALMKQLDSKSRNGR